MRAVVLWNWLVGLVLGLVLGILPALVEPVEDLGLEQLVVLASALRRMVPTRPRLPGDACSAPVPYAPRLCSAPSRSPRNTGRTTQDEGRSQASGSRARSDAATGAYEDTFAQTGAHPGRQASTQAFGTHRAESPFAAFAAGPVPVSRAAQGARSITRQALILRSANCPRESVGPSAVPRRDFTTRNRGGFNCRSGRAAKCMPPTGPMLTRR